MQNKQDNKTNAEMHAKAHQIAHICGLAVILIVAAIGGWLLGPYSPVIKMKPTLFAHILKLLASIIIFITILKTVWAYFDSNETFYDYYCDFINWIYVKIINNRNKRLLHTAS